MGKKFIISGPSGVGKSTVIQMIRSEFPALRFALSATTRPRRPGEPKSAYLFCSKEDFLLMQAQGAFIETVNQGGYLYGTLTRSLEETGDMLFDVNADGAMEIRKKHPDAILIILLPPSFDALEQRLRSRKDGTAEENILYRLACAKREMACSSLYDYAITNDDLSGCIRQLETIIREELGKKEAK